MVKVSVIMLAYNSAQYIGEAIRGVVRQKADFKIQLVVSDDNSTDNTREICEHYKSLYPDIITFNRNEKNLGLQRNFMKAYSLCEGEYVTMCDGDDYWCDNNKLKIMVSYMDSHPKCAVAFHRVINYFEGTGTKSLSNGGQKQDMTALELAVSNTITNCSCMYRRSNCPVLPEWISEIKLCDYAMHILNARNGYVHYFKRPMAVYRQRKNAIWSLKNLSDWEAKLNLSLHVRELLIENLAESNHDISEVLRDAHTRFTLQGMRTSLDNGLADAAERFRARLLKFRPSMTDIEIEEALKRLAEEKRKNMLKTSFRKCLKHARAFVSLFVPLPRV